MSSTLKSRLSNTALAIFAVASVGLAISLFIFKIGFTTLVSNSMSPSIPVGSIVITHQVSTSDIRPGQIVKLPLPDSSAQYVHRVMTADPGKLGVEMTTKGDNNPAQDPWKLAITSSETPVVIASVPLVGFLNNLTGNFWIQMALVGLVVLLLTSSLIRYLRG